ncbi:unnamed protein product [Timema podura]|uniref:Uncharacterized protein n=1 Tax=Timema podura TaxID=61482 RepID=A0ABN7NKI7_TIMPD|nr:unnamed protein product [Timema podura]
MTLEVDGNTVPQQQYKSIAVDREKFQPMEMFVRCEEGHNISVKTAATSTNFGNEGSLQVDMVSVRTQGSLGSSNVLEIQASYNSAQDMEDPHESPIALPESPIPPPKSAIPSPESPLAPPESPIPPPESPIPPPDSPIPPSKSPIPPPESPIPPPESPIPPPDSPIPPSKSPIPPPESPIPPPKSPIPPPELPISPELTTPNFKNLSPDTSGTCSRLDSLTMFSPAPFERAHRTAWLILLSAWLKLMVGLSYKSKHDSFYRVGLSYSGGWWARELGKQP